MHAYDLQALRRVVLFDIHTVAGKQLIQFRARFCLVDVVHFPTVFFVLQQLLLTESQHREGVRSSLL